MNDNNLNQNIEQETIVEQLQVDSGVNEQAQEDFRMVKEQLNMENMDKIRNDNKSKKKLSLIIVGAITVAYIIFLLVFLKSESRNSAYPGLAIAGFVVFSFRGIKFIWLTYLIWLFFYKIFSAKKLPAIKSLTLVVIILVIYFIIKFWGPLIFSTLKVNVEELKLSKKDRISSIERETVCIKENNNYVPYVVADNKYAFTSNSLLVRKKALTKKLKYYKLYTNDDNFKRTYDNTLIDEYLTSNEWLNRFDEKFLNTINNTLLNQEYSFKEHKIYRNFFIISANEYHGFHSESEWLKMAKSGGMPDDWVYYYTEKQVYDDANNIVNYWIVRIDDQNDDVMKCNSNGCIPLSYNDQSKYYFRPAFTISNDTKIIKNSDKKYDCKWFIDMNNN